MKYVHKQKGTMAQKAHALAQGTDRSIVICLSHMHHCAGHHTITHRAVVMHTHSSR